MCNLIGLLGYHTHCLKCFFLLIIIVVGCYFEVLASVTAPLDFSEARRLHRAPHHTHPLHHLSHGIVALPVASSALTLPPSLPTLSINNCPLRARVLASAESPDYSLVGLASALAPSRMALR